VLLAEQLLITSSDGLQPNSDGLHLVASNVQAIDEKGPLSQMLLLDLTGTARN